jgi:putative ABC transport system permease protein
MAAALMLAYVPRLPSTSAAAGLGLAHGGLRITRSTNRRLRMFGTAQIALSFLLLAGAAMLLTTLAALEHARTGYDMERVIAFDISASAPAAGAGASTVDFYREMTRRISALPGVDGVAVGMFVPWRDAGNLGPPVTFAVEGYQPVNGEPDPRARFRVVGPKFFDVVGVPLVAGREFTDGDRAGADSVCIVSQSLAERLFPNGSALNRTFRLTDPYFARRSGSRIVGVVADVDDEHVVAEPAMMVYYAVAQVGVAGRLFVRASGDPYALVPPITRTIRQLSPDQPVERAATLEDVRARVLAPERINAFVFSGFAGIAMLIAVVGVAGVLAFSVSARAREFGIRLAVGSPPSHLLKGVLSEGIVIASFGIAVGAAGGFLLARISTHVFDQARTPDAVSIVGAAAVLIAAAITASLMPAARAARVDVLQVLRSQ